jgi:aryl-alcohol dehydrogenase-like predicted oxidoreductase
VAACDASLRRLGIDVIDLYQIHAPDPDAALEDTLAALDGLVRAGKVRALGASNFPAWLLAWAVALQDREGLSPFVSLQPQYSLVERSIETEILPFCRAAGLGVLPWGPLGAGFLTGRYSRDEAPPPGTRIGDAADDLEEAIDRRGTEANFRAVDEARAVADELGASVAQVALAWLLAQPGVTAPIVGPRTLEQLEDLLPAAELTLTDEQVERLGRWTAPPRRYPERMNVEQNGIDVGAIRLRR